MYENLTGVILAGGKSQRMGKNKSFLIWKDKPIIESIVDLMKSCFRQNILIANEPDLYSNLGLPIFPDIFTGSPLAGIHSALTNSKTSRIFVISCDMPLIQKKTIQIIVENYKEEKLFIPYADGFMQHLCGIYSKELLPVIEEILNSKEEPLSKDKTKACKMGNLFQKVNGKKLNLDSLSPEIAQTEFLNINTPEDYKKLDDLPAKTHLR